MHIDNKMYTVVSAVFNVEKYLDKYFRSLTSQSLDFRKNINLIMIDDGSTDNSKEIILTWKHRYPENITYIYQDNAGQAEARNKGLLNLKTLWVTFIDPDDFISKHYFKNVNIFLEKHKDKTISLVACKIVYYFEHLRLPLDYHPLRYNFKKNEEIVKAEDMGNHIQLSASTAFFKTQCIDDMHLQFNSKIKPNFEDGFFIGMYLLQYSKESIAFLTQSKYFYRKRRNGTSTVDQSWQQVEKYEDLLKYGYFDLLNTYKNNLGFVPIFIQRTVLYELLWHYKSIIDNPNIIEYLTAAQRDRYKGLLHSLFIFIDTKTIMEFELAGCHFYHKVAFISKYKKEKLSYQIVYIDKFLKRDGMLYFHYYAYEKSIVDIYIDDILIKSTIVEIDEIKFMDDKFILKYYIRASLNKSAKNLKIKIDDIDTYVNINNQEEILIKNITIKKSNKIKNIFKNIGRKVLL